MKRLTKTLSWLSVLTLIVFISCQKQIDTPSPQQQSERAAAANSNKEHGHLQQTKTFSSDLVVRWINVQLDMLRLPLPAGTGTTGTDRAQAYSGIALYEAVVNGMPAYQSLYGQLNGFPSMPSTEPGKAYHWAASANAALAEISRRLFPTTADANKTRITHVEDSLNAKYAGEVVDAATLKRSTDFGKEVATRVANWATTDGSVNNDTYVFPPGTGLPPAGTGLWVPTSAPPAALVGPFAWKRRLIVAGSSNGTALAPLPPFSSNPSSAFYAMVKEVYDASLVLTTDQKRMADYFKDNPGYGPGGGFVRVFQEALKIAQPTLEAAITYAKVGMAQHDVTIVLFTNKYIFNVIRPVTYIKAYINSAWNTYIPTPNHPEFPSGHATTNGAVVTMLNNSFGENFPITLHTYDYLNIAPSFNYPPRHYNNFTEIGTDMADSRIYGGLHYRETQTKSLIQGKKVAQNILSTIKFLKD